MKKKNNFNLRQQRVFLFSILIIAIALSFYFDIEIIKFVDSIKGNFLDNFFIGIEFISAELVIFSFLTILFFFKKTKNLSKDRIKQIFRLWVTFFLAAAISLSLKVIIKRPRPFQLDIVSIMPLLQKSSYFIWNFSFPSFHSMFVFCSVPLVIKRFPKFKYIWIVFAVLVAFSRVYFGLHFLSDVLVGGLIGYLLGTLVIKIDEKNKIGERISRRIIKRD